MTLNNPRSVERDNQNALRKFPFADSASCTNGDCVIVPGAIVDMQIYVFGRQYDRIWLSSVDSLGKLHFSDAGGEFAETAYPMTANSAVPVTFTGDGGPINGGVVVFGNASDVSALRSLGGEEFTEDETEIVPAAVARPGLPGVTGFKLDDGNIVFGDVKMRGTNGCDVATYMHSDGTMRLRISAIGTDVDVQSVTGYIKTVVAESDNTNFIVSGDKSDFTVEILATGVSTLQDAMLSADQDNTCEAVRSARGTVPSASATVPPDCGDVCNDTITQSHSITFMDGLVQVGLPLMVFEGSSLGTLDATNMPDPTTHSGKRFAGYFDKDEAAVEIADMQLYYRYNGEGTGKFTSKTDITLYAHWVDASSKVIVHFEDPVTHEGYRYGTLHLAAPDTSTYSNPIVISGIESPIPVVKEISDETVINGGADALAEIVLHPTVPSGTVTIGIRGLNKAYTT